MILFNALMILKNTAVILQTGCIIPQYPRMILTITPTILNRPNDPTKTLKIMFSGQISIRSHPGNCMKNTLVKPNGIYKFGGRPFDSM